MSKKVNVVLARHYDKDIARVFQLPNDIEVAPLELLLCNTAVGNDQIVTSISPNFLVDEDKFESFCNFNGTSPDRVMPITGKIDNARFGVAPAKKQVKEKKAEEKPDDELIPGIHLQKVGPGAVAMSIDLPEEDDDDEETPSLFELCNIGLAALKEMLGTIERHGGAKCEKAEYLDRLEDFNHALVEAALHGFGALVEVAGKGEGE